LPLRSAVGIYNLLNWVSGHNRLLTPSQSMVLSN